MELQFDVQLHFFYGHSRNLKNHKFDADKNLLMCYNIN